MTILSSTISRNIFFSSTSNILRETFTACQRVVCSRVRVRREQIRHYSDNFKRSVGFKILNDSHFRTSDDPSSNIELKDLKLTYGDNDLVVNLTWLRDSCHCSQCTHQFSRQRLFTPKQFLRHMFNVVEVQIQDRNVSETSPQTVRPSLDDDKDTLIVKWADGHKSEYSLRWLSYVVNLNQEKQLGSSQSRVAYKYPKDDYYLPFKRNATITKCWNVPTVKKLLYDVNYHDLIEGFEFNDNANFINANKIDSMSSKRYGALLALSKQLVGLGLAKIVNVPQERNQVLNVARSLAYERPTGYGVVFDVVVEPSEEINLAYSSLEFDLHSDLPYRETSPGVQLLHCIRDSIEGGLSYFSDSFLAAQTLREERPKLFDALVNFPATFAVRDPYRDTKFRRQQPMIRLDHEGEICEVNYSPFTLPPLGHKDDVKLFYLALDKFTQLLHSEENKYIVKMNPGDLFIFHNRRVLHGRSAYNATNSSRFLQGCYMDWDEIKCLDEKLRSHLETSIN